MFVAARRPDFARGVGIYLGDREADSEVRPCGPPQNLRRPPHWHNEQHSA
jgi:hypothetical protein